MAVPGMQGLDTLYKPWGMTAGGMVGRRETDMEAADLLNLEEGMLGNVIKQVEASRAANDFSNPEMERWRQAKLMGEGMQQDALGRLKQGTLNTDISAGNQKNQTDTLENQAKAWMTESDMIMSLPDGLAGVGAQLSPQMQQLAQQVGGIDRLKQVLPRFNEMLKQRLSQTPKFLGEKEMENIKFGNRISADSAQQTQKHTNDMERVRFEATAHDARQKEHDANLKAIEQSRRSDAEKIQSLEQLATSYLKAAEEATDPADRDSYMKSYEKAYNALMGSKTAASSAKSLGDVNAVRALRGLPPLTQEQYDQQQKQGGSTGTTGGWGATEIKATR